MHLFPILLLAASWTSGQVVYILPHTSPTNGLFVINDEHARRIVISNARKPPLVGDIVRFRTSGQDSPWSVVDTFEVLGHRQPPAPQAIPLSDVRAERYQLKLVRVQGILVDAFKDEIDSAWNWLLLRARGVTVPIAWSGDADSLRHATSLIGAEISVDGCSMPQHRGQRLFLSSLIEFNDFSSVKVLRPVAQNLTNAPPISLTSAWQPDGLQSVVGRVTACWGKGNVFLLTEKDRTLQVSLRQTVRKPALGTTIRAVGFAEMNSFFLSMRQAEWSPHATDLKTPEQPVLRPSARDLSADDDGYLKFRPHYNGRPIAVRGTACQRPVASVFNRFSLATSGQIITVILPHDVPERELPAAGSELEVNGICHIELASESANPDFARIEGFSIITRDPKDIIVLKSPPWWTTTMLLTAIGSLLATLFGILLWNIALNRRAKAKGRELAAEQLAHVTSELKVNERTRLAVELHDALSQTLTGVSMQIDTAAGFAEGKAPAITKCLNLASRTIDACRMELRNTLWDLRSSALDEPSMDAAIRKTLCQNLAGIDLSVRFAVPRKVFSDNTAHAILKIIRELAANALRHGKATSLWIAGTIDGDRLLFSVKDNGCGFDPDLAPGISQGHFGLQGISERVERLNGEMRIESSTDRGTKVTVALPFPRPGE